MRKTIPALGGADSDRFGHKVYAHEGQRVLVMHRWADRGPSALVILGYNKAPATLTLHEPIGEWRLGLDTNRAHVGEAGRAIAPPQLCITPNGATVDLTPYAAVVYLSATQA